MGCKKCGNNVCGGGCKTKVITKLGFAGKSGRRGPAGKASITVRDSQGVPTILTGINQINFTDNTAFVTSGGPGIANVSFVPAATVWNDILNLPWYVSGSESIKPQYTIEGNRISFRGLLYMPLDNSGLVNVSNGNSYLGVASATLRNASVSVVTNANTNNGTPQGRFMTTDIVNNKNLPPGVIPVGRDIVFTNIPAFRRYSGAVGLGDVNVTNLRTYVSVRIGSSNTVYKNGTTNLGTGCIMVFSPFNDEYDGSANVPIGHDPLAFGISRVTATENAVDYIGATDNSPFAIASSGKVIPFSCNAHHINELGGFIINLEGLSGYLN